MVRLLAGAGGGASPSPGPSAPPASPTTQALQSASAQLDGANPNGVLQVLTQMNQDLAQLYLMTAMRMPDATKDIGNAREAIGRAIKTAQKAAQAQTAVAPIVNNAGIGPVMSPPQGQPDLSALLPQAAM